MKDHNHFNALETTEEFWQARINAASVITHPTAKGDVAEMAWRDLLRGYLPTQYRVSSGFVVSADNKRSDQIDCIIYDNTYTPIFFGEHGLSCIPAEAVYAVFEVKQNVTVRHIQAASEKAASVRRCRRTTAPYISDGQLKSPKQHFPIVAGLMAREITTRTWKTQVSSLNSLQRKNPVGFLDIILTAESGSVDFFETGFPADGPQIHSSKCGLMLGVLQLVKALQRQGTVPAMDWNDWLTNLKS